MRKISRRLQLRPLVWSATYFLASRLPLGCYDSIDEYLSSWRSSARRAGPRRVGSLQIHLLHGAWGFILTPLPLRRCSSQYGDLIRSYIKDGQIVPMEVTIKLLQNAMSAVRRSELSTVLQPRLFTSSSVFRFRHTAQAYEKGSKRFLIDGFPRKMDQAIKFDESVGLRSLRPLLLLSSGAERLSPGLPRCTGPVPDLYRRDHARATVGARQDLRSSRR